MKTELFIGYNVGKIGYKYIGTLKVFGNYSLDFMDEMTRKLCEEITSISEANYCIEKYRNNRY